jgi:uncharacterized protein
MKTLSVAKDFPLPDSAVTQTFAILGIRGSGKTNTGVVLAEELLKRKQQIVVIDPVDVWWGLKSSKDGKAAGFPIPVIGGDHADVPLEAAAGVVLADFVTDTQASVILSLRHLSMNDQRRFAGDFARRLYERKGQQRSPLMLLVDEADEFVPQRLPHGHEAMFGAFDRLVRRGRTSGIGVTLISQRAQVINKDVLSQVETLVGMRVLHKLDRKALEAWIEAHDTEGKGEEFMGSLASLGLGDAWIWSPSWLNVFRRVHIRKRETYDSSATPAAGAAIAAPKQVAEVDLEKLKTQMSATIERAKADDPRELRRRIADLEKQLKQKLPAGIDSDAVEKARKDGYRDGVRAENHRLSQLIGKAVETVREACVELKNETPAISKTPAPAPAPAHSINARRDFTPPPPRPVARQRVVESNGPLGKGELAILSAVVQHGGAERRQLTVLTGYKRSSRDTYIQRLGAAGLVTTSGQKVFATESGLAAVDGLIERLPEGRALLDHWLARLPEGERAVLSAIAEAGEIDRDAISDATGYKRSSRDTYLQRLSARQLIERSESGGPIRIAPELRG